MKTLRLLSAVGITSIALAHAGWAAGHSGGGGGVGGGGFSGGGHFGGGGDRVGAGGGFHPGLNGGAGYYYSRGMRFGNSAGRYSSSQARLPLSRPHVINGPDRSMTNRVVNSRPTVGNRAMTSAARPARTSARPTLNGRTDHIAERHDQNWHRDWDRRHAHFSNHRFFVFDDGFWFGLDAGFFPWDYYPYYAYDYYPYDYYPGDYTDVQPYDNSVPVADATVPDAACPTGLLQRSSRWHFWTDNA